MQRCYKGKERKDLSLNHTLNILKKLGGGGGGSQQCVVELLPEDLSLGCFGAGRHLKDVRAKISIENKPTEVLG